VSFVSQYISRRTRRLPLVSKTICSFFTVNYHQVNQYQHMHSSMTDIRLENRCGTRVLVKKHIHQANITSCIHWSLSIKPLEYWTHYLLWIDNRGHEPVEDYSRLFLVCRFGHTNEPLATYQYQRRTIRTISGLVYYTSLPSNRNKQSRFLLGLFGRSWDYKISARIVLRGWQ
jgi:hypothetical protein